MDWMTTFSRFQPGRMPLVGPIAVHVADWSKPRPGRAPMFDETWLERLTVAHPFWPAAVYGPAGCVSIWQASRGRLTLGAVLGAYAGGLLIWSLVEYLTHRLSFHHVPTTRGQVAYGYLVHGVHHAYPDDPRRWVLPIAVTLPIAAALFWLFGSLFGRFGLPVFGGFVHGYLAYDLLHYFIHSGRLPTRLGRYLRHYHLTHHFKSPDGHFGVSSPLWDVIFRTR
jgi:hypothetical protein